MNQKKQNFKSFYFKKIIQQIIKKHFKYKRLYFKIDVSKTEKSRF